MDNTEFDRELFLTDAYAVKTTGIKIEECNEDYARCSMEIDDRHFNMYGNVMGGAIFTLADYTFGITANTGKPETVSLTSTINFMRGTRGPVLYAEARCVKSGKNICFYEVTITDDENNIIAVAQANGFVKQTAKYK